MGLLLFYHIYSFTPYGGQTINHEGKRRSCDGPMDRTEVNQIGQKLGPALKGPALELPTLGCSSTHNNTL